MQAHTDSGLETVRILADRNREVRRETVSRKERQANEHHNKYFPVLSRSGPTGFVPQAVAQSKVHSYVGQGRQLSVGVPTNLSLIQLREFRVLWKKQSRCEIRAAAKCGANVRVNSRHTTQSRPRAHPRLGLARYSPSPARLTVETQAANCHRPSVGTWLCV